MTTIAAMAASGRSLEIAGLAHLCVGSSSKLPMWPHYSCDEHGGLGWEAEVLSATSVTAVVRYLHARTPTGRPYEDVRLALSRLRPV